MSAYGIAITPAAQKSLSLLHKPLVRQVKDAVFALGEQPRPYGCLKLSGKNDLYRVRVGSYRIVYEISDADKTVIITYIEPRDKAYKRFRH